MPRADGLKLFACSPMRTTERPEADAHTSHTRCCQNLSPAHCLHRASTFSHPPPLMRPEGSLQERKDERCRGTMKGLHVMRGVSQGREKSSTRLSKSTTSRYLALPTCRVPRPIASRCQLRQDAPPGLRLFSNNSHECMRATHARGCMRACLPACACACVCTRAP